MLEWSLLAAVLVVLVLLFARHVRVIKGQGELAAVRSTLGALRTALVIGHLKKNVVIESSSVASTQRNPFDLLQRHPANYVGEMTPAQAVAAPAGSWVFDPVCACVGYLPMDPQWFDSPSGGAMAWYQLQGAPGPLQLVAKEAYVWQGLVMN
ncbi:hypothetical protein [Rhodoferax ferrireducens]|uniref:hypothetical protein n=1 Tax=Rhodoferax ferrireducens TaxID=192843 RepID=UPI000E0D2258|nr:hypothetical protein [Rhodoferax ferrireducens]